MGASRAEVLISILAYALSLAFAALSNVWLTVWGRRLSVLNTYFRSHHPLVDADTVRIDPFDLAALEASFASAATDAASSEGDTCEDAVTGAPVFDLGLHFLPHLHVTWLPDAFVFALMPLLAAAVFIPTPASPHTRTRPQPQAYCSAVLSRLCCVLQSHSLILLMRSTTTLATVHRSSPICHALSLHSSPSAAVGFVLNTGCFDLMFSGHTAFCVMVAFYVCHRPELRWWGWQLLVSAVGAVGSVSNVLVGDHYTADCLVAVNIALLTCCLYRQRFKQTFAIDSTNEQKLDTSATHQSLSKGDKAQLQRHTHPKRGVSRNRAASKDSAQPMDTEDEVQRTAQQPHDDMDVEPNETVGADDAEEAEQSYAYREECGDEKELQQLIHRWQLADSHGAVANAQRHTRRHTDIR